MNIARDAAAGLVVQSTPKRASIKLWDLFGAAAFLVVAIEFYMGLIWAPTDANQHEPYRIVYVHVPMIIASYVAFALVFVASILYLWRRKPVFDIFARSSAEVGFFFLTLVLISGGIWGEATWGAAWTPEPTLIFTAVLWLIFLSYIMLRGAGDNRERMARYCAVVGIIGFANIPMIASASYLFRSVHPTPTVPPAQIGYTLLVGFVGFLMLFAYLLNLRFRIDRAQARVEELRAEREEASI